MLDTIDELNSKFDDRYRGKLVREDNLSQSLVSFQANKERSYRVVACKRLIKRSPLKEYFTVVAVVFRAASR